MLVPELTRTIVPFPQTLNSPQTPPAPSTTDQPLLPPFANGGIPRLESPVDSRFLHFNAVLAGQAVVLELYAPEHATSAQRVALWRWVAQEGVDLKELGLCAQALERAFINWRQADSFEIILDAARALARLQHD